MGFYRNLFAALLVWLSAGSMVQAATLDFEFSFTGGVTDGSPLVTGIVRGLAEGTNSVDTIEITSNSAGYGIGSYTHNALVPSASWTVTGGTLTDWVFVSAGARNAPTQVTDSSLVLTSSLLLRPSGLDFFQGFSALTQDDVRIDIEGTTPAVFQPVSAVPLPAGLPLVLTGLAGSGILRLKRKRAVQA